MLGKTLQTPAPKRRRSSIVFRLLGPGLVTGAADDDPSGIATYSQAGSQFGYGLLWTIFLTTPFMIAIQLISAHIGRVTGKGIAANANQFCSFPMLVLSVSLLVAANTINIAADIAAMAAALQLVIGGLRHEHALIFAASSVLLQIFVPYPRYAPILKSLTLVLFCYVAVALTVEVPWAQVLVSTFLPSVSLNRDFLIILVAVLGTTISPYLFFWQASQEVEEMRRKHGHPRRPLNILTRGGGKELTRITIDTTAGMVLSNLVAYSIILATASTLHAHGIIDIQTAANAAEALRPIAGNLTFLLFALGIIGTGLLAIPVLAGSAAYAVAEVFGWPHSLAARFPEALGFYTIIFLATLLGFAMGFLPINPIKLLVWTAVINGIVAVPIMAMMMSIVTNSEAMGRFKARPSLAIAGWGATALMSVTVGALLWSVIF